MNVVTTDEFAAAFGIKLRAAQCALASAAQGKTWRGHTLSVVEIESQRGGDGGKVWGLRLDVAPAAIRDLFEVSSTAFEQPLERPFKGALNTAAYDTHAERMALLYSLFWKLHQRVRHAKRPMPLLLKNQASQRKR